MVLKRDGTLKTKTRGRSPTVFRSPAAAQRFAVDDGDSVVTISLDLETLAASATIPFIRNKPL